MRPVLQQKKDAGLASFFCCRLTLDSALGGGWRYYTNQQLTILNRILALKDPGFSLVIFLIKLFRINRMYLCDNCHVC